MPLFQQTPKFIVFYFQIINLEQLGNEKLGFQK